ncbi:breast carcinoma-amplified sequence 1 isoform X2 [Denticeps clupeoides]|uniref:breast carcinoma-amplified sequence 1 isoform X2 n=1 Tax=Denticeps clupeoides TaxID=299321 RepID=UPI0010A46AE7|nr:titin-like isoform X2 [Denticeps clupeoides]
MGNLPSNQEPLQAEAKDQNGGLNGHAVAVTDAGTGPHVDKHLLPDGCVPLISAPETSPALPGKDPALVQTNGHQLPEQPESSEPRAPQDAAAAPKLLGEEKVNLFGKMFKKKPDAPPVPPEKVEDLVTPADQQTSPKREDAAPDVGAEKQPEQQMSNGAGPDPAEAPAEAAAKPPPEQKKRFSGLFKKKPESPPAAEPGGPPGGTETPAAANEQPRSSEEKSKHPIADSSGMRPSEKQVNAAAVVTKDDPGSAPKDGDEKPKRFGKLFMKKSGNTPAVEVEISPDQTPAVDVHLQAMPEETVPEKEPELQAVSASEKKPFSNLFKKSESPPAESPPVQTKAVVETPSQLPKPEADVQLKDATLTPVEPEKKSTFGSLFKKKPISPIVVEVDNLQVQTELLGTKDHQPSPKREDAAPDVGAEKQPEQQMSNGAGPDPAEAPAEAAAKPPPEQKKRFSGLFKKKPESPPAAEPGGPPGGTETPAAANEQPRSSEEKHPIADSSGMRPSEKQVNAAAVVTKDDPGSAPKDGDEKPKRFGKLFMKKSGNTPAVEVEISPDQTPAVDVHLQAEPGDIKEGTEPQQDPDRESLDLVPAAAQLAPQPQEHPVMNFFKTLVSPTRTPKEAAAGPDGSREQPQKEPAAAAQSAEVDAAKAKVPPPPPPEPPKMAEPAARKEDVKDTPKQAEPAAKPKAAKESPFNKIFRPKVLAGWKASKKPNPAPGGATAPSAAASAVDASKTATLEAAAKPEAPALPAPREEEKKSEKRASPFASFFKPKVLLDQVASRMQAVGISTRIGRPAKSSAAAPEQKKDTPVTAAAPPPEAPQGARAKEDPKSAPPATPPVPDSKPAESAENASPSTARREKRNSIQLFFRNLGQKRHSDAGVQTEAPAAGSTVERGK